MQPKTVVHCKTDEEANELLKWANSQGLRWHDGSSYLERTYFGKFDEMCYYITRGEYCEKVYYENKGYTILEYDEVLIKEQKISIEVGSKWQHKDGGVYEVVAVGQNSYFNGQIERKFIYCVWYQDKQGEVFVRTEKHFLQSFKPYQLQP